MPVKILQIIECKNKIRSQVLYFDIVYKKYIFSHTLKNIVHCIIKALENIVFTKSASTLNGKSHRRIVTVHLDELVILFRQLQIFHIIFLLLVSLGTVTSREQLCPAPAAALLGRGAVLWLLPKSSILGTVLLDPTTAAALSLNIWPMQASGQPWKE